MIKGYFALVLHGHLPYVRHPKHDLFLEELWFFEALSETYLPILRVLNELEKKGIHFPITISLSPTLLEMMNDSLLKNRFIRYLKCRLELIEKEKKRHKGNSEFHELAVFYDDFYKKNLHDFQNKYDGNIIKAFKETQRKRQTELWTTSATHCNLNLFSHEEWSVKAQIKIGLSTFEKHFGFKPRGFWLPECGYYRGLDSILRSFDIDYTILDSHSFLFGTPRPLSAVYLPVKTLRGLDLFSRDLSFSQQIWSNETGYPGAPAYREFYSDLAYDLSREELFPCVHPDGIDINTGIKYYQVTDKEKLEKEPYNRLRALSQVKEHSMDLIRKINGMTQKLSSFLTPPPLITAPFDAELFGHWWFEGPDFLKEVAIAREKENPCFEFIQLSDYINKNPSGQFCEPSPSSWGKNGYSEMWLNNSNDWIYPLLYPKARHFSRILKEKSDINPIEKRLLKQAGKELLLAQSSDWPFIIRTGTTVKYAEYRVKDHIMACEKLCDSVNDQNYDETFLKEREKQYPLFSQIELDDFLI